MITKLIRLIAIAAFTIVVSTGDILASQKAAGPAAVSVTDIKVSFKLDPRLTRGLYMGERWVSPPTYIGASGQDTIEARALGIDDKGRPVNIRTEWIPIDPEMVTITPGRGNEVRITVRRAGESSLKVAAPGFSRELAIKARSYMGNSILVEISQ